MFSVPNPLSQILLSIKDRQNESNCLLPDPQNSGRTLVKQDYPSTVGNKRQYPINKFKTKRTHYACASSSSSNGVVENAPWALPTALENQGHGLRK
jgi:hypothetical protein